MGKFWESIGSKLGERVIGVVLGPAALFWLGGFIAYAYVHGWKDVDAQVRWLSGQPALALALAALAVACSTAVEQVLTVLTLRILEGYGPLWRLGADARAQRIDRRLEESAAEWQTLAARDSTTLSRRDRERYVALDEIARRAPADPPDRLPTALGNTLRASERRPRDKYGLDGVVCWPRLWLLLPTDVRTELEDARGALDRAAQIWIWGTLLAGWSLLAPWVLLAVPLMLAIAHRRLLAAAEVYGDLFESSFDLYRSKLYESLRWPLPATTADERANGLRLTEYLVRGTVGTPVTYVQPEEPGDSQPA
jgi:hypothetical protein